MATLMTSETETVTLEPSQLRGLIEDLGAELLGVRSYDHLVAMCKAGQLADRPGTSYLESLLELSA
jgi:hypothetical protein